MSAKAETAYKFLFFLPRKTTEVFLDPRAFEEAWRVGADAPEVSGRGDLESRLKGAELCSCKLSYCFAGDVTVSLEDEVEKTSFITGNFGTWMVLGSLCTPCQEAKSGIFWCSSSRL